jgi:hypothetical protein
MSLIGVRGRRWVIWAVVLSLLGGGAVLGGRFWRGTRPVHLLATGIAAYDRRDWPAAEKVARQRLKTHRDDAEAQRLLARSLLRQGRDRVALSIRARLPEPLKTAEDYFLRGQAAVRMRQKELGILAWRQALGKDNDHVETLLGLEQTLLRLDLLHEAAPAA